jgi:predicted ABC-type transport system involved in lysophospholipase L1 biosynthesis ATPase subunit
VFVEGEAVQAFEEEARRKVRERRLGFAFAAPFLLPAFSVIENVAMPLFKVSDVEPAEARQRSEALLEFAGLGALAQAPCAQLAAFDQQRVSLARALVNEPAALLVESLDSALGEEDLATFAALLRGAAAHFGIAVIATVSPRFVPAREDRLVEVAHGAVRTGDNLLPQR